MPEKVTTEIFRVYGVVQGVGFRPFVSRLADRMNVRGTVANKGAYVEIFAQGDAEVLTQFQKALQSEAPERSAVLKILRSVTEHPAFAKFDIIESQVDRSAVFVSPDIATCPVCSAELYDKNNRRYLHPFINCTACGPRLTITDELPYDRERTSMKEFPMCPDCASEYHDPASRRYDAQPVCCNDCGPEVYLLDQAERGSAAITRTRQMIMNGLVVAIKGIGGFHLACDARNEAAVQRLRELKRRPVKPFAVMMRDLDTVRTECEVSPEQSAILTGHQKPIILLNKKPDSALPGVLAPDNPTLGVMLPYAPIQMLLFDYPDGIEFTDTLVMTSGNAAGAPICRNEDDARKEIGTFCDGILSHNRRIRLRADDSVMDFFENKPYMIRRSRGYAPLPFMLNSRNFKGTVLGIGGELKNAFCIAKDNLCYLAPHLGDMEDIRTVNALNESIARMSSLLSARPELVVADLHPKYNTSAVADSLGLEVIKIQHHYAHILSAMAENDYLDPVIGVAMDGTGLGTDRTIWGGEIMIADLNDFQRVGHIQSFIQSGGDASSREGWRIAASMLHGIFAGDGSNIAETLQLCSSQEYKIQSLMSEKMLNSVSSTSTGRLFDAVSAVLGICRASTFEGEAAMKLEFAARRFARHHSPLTAIDDPAEQWLTSDSDQLILTTDLMFKNIVKMKSAGMDTEALAYYFHSALADRIIAGCEAVRKSHRLDTVALSGGSFQNKLLLELTINGLRKKQFRILLHSLTPPNDGGVALGQALKGLQYLQV